METYTALRQFADSWALLALTLFFVGVVIFVFRRGSRRKYEDAASIPFKDSKDPKDPKNAKDAKDD